MEEVYQWLKDINDRHPSFDPSKWVAPWSRIRVDKTGAQYRNFKFNKATKTVWYEMKLTPNDRWSGPYHGRTWKMLEKLETI